MLYTNNILYPVYEDGATSSLDNLNSTGSHSPPKKSICSRFCNWLTRLFTCNKRNNSNDIIQRNRDGHNNHSINNSHNNDPLVCQQFRNEYSTGFSN
jgi:hypothetical protein